MVRNMNIENTTIVVILRKQSILIVVWTEIMMGHFVNLLRLSKNLIWCRKYTMIDNAHTHTQSFFILYHFRRFFVTSSSKKKKNVGYAARFDGSSFQITLMINVKPISHWLLVIFSSVVVVAFRWSWSVTLITIRATRSEVLRNWYPDNKSCDWFCVCMCSSSSSRVLHNVSLLKA